MIFEFNIGPKIKFDRLESFNKKVLARMAKLFLDLKIQLQTCFMSNPASCMFNIPSNLAFYLAVLRKLRSELEESANANCLGNSLQKLAKEREIGMAHLDKAIGLMDGKFEEILKGIERGMAGLDRIRRCQNEIVVIDDEEDWAGDRRTNADWSDHLNGVSIFDDVCEFRIFVANLIFYYNILLINKTGI